MPWVRTCQMSSASCLSNDGTVERPTTLCVPLIIGFANLLRMRKGRQTFLGSFGILALRSLTAG